MFYIKLDLGKCAELQETHTKRGMGITRNSYTSNYLWHR